MLYLGFHSLRDHKVFSSTDKKIFTVTAVGTATIMGALLNDFSHLSAGNASLKVPDQPHK
jgi:hypothetical protein